MSKTILYIILGVCVVALAGLALYVAGCLTGYDYLSSIEVIVLDR